MVDFRWIEFLSALSVKDRNPYGYQTKIPEKNLVLKESDYEKCLSKQVSRRLLQHDEQVRQAAVEKEVDKMHLVGGEDTHSSLVQTKNTREIDVHLDSSASKWNVYYLIRYIKSDQVVVGSSSLTKDLSLSEIMAMMEKSKFKQISQESLLRSSQQTLDEGFSLDSDTGNEVNGLKLWNLQYSDPPVNEQVISILVQSILGPLCQMLDIKMKPEKKFQKDTKFGTARVDFALEYKGICVGVLELKTPKTLGPDSVAQLLLPLMKLQEQNKNAFMPYLGILTDGYRYVFVILKGEKFFFENAGSTVRDPTITIHKPIAWIDLQNLLEYIGAILVDIRTYLDGCNRLVCHT